MLEDEYRPVLPAATKRNIMQRAQNLLDQQLGKLLQLRSATADANALAPAFEAVNEYCKREFSKEELYTPDHLNALESLRASLEPHMAGINSAGEKAGKLLSGITDTGESETTPEKLECMVDAVLSVNQIYNACVNVQRWQQQLEADDHSPFSQSPPTSPIWTPG